MGNTVGSPTSLLATTNDAYILGLWGADRYLRTSSIDLSNTNPKLLFRFANFLISRFTEDRIRIRSYSSSVYPELQKFKISYCKGSKNKLPAFHVYVNSRPLVREFTQSLSQRKLLFGDNVYAYFAGRFDGDGSVSGKHLRIVYGDIGDLNADRELLQDIKTSVYEYSSAGTYCLYFSRRTVKMFIERISLYSISGKLL